MSEKLSEEPHNVDLRPVCDVTPPISLFSSLSLFPSQLPFPCPKETLFHTILMAGTSEGREASARAHRGTSIHLTILCLYQTYPWLPFLSFLQNTTITRSQPLPCMVGLGNLESPVQPRLAWDLILLLRPLKCW